MSEIKEKTTTWYTIKVQANRERYVAERLKLEAEKEGFKNLKQVVVPMEKVYYVKDGKKMSRDKITYPGYIFVEVEDIGEFQWILRQIRGNSGLLKDRAGNPIPIKESEINHILDQIKERNEIDQTKYIVGEKVKISNGAFAGFHSTIEEINSDKNKVRLSVSIFGRITYLELELSQIDKIH
jgi:transcriptional antiterminator NusG